MRILRTGFGVSYVPFVDNSYAYNYPIKTSTRYTNSPTYGPALNPVGGVINLVTGIPATATVTFPTNGTLIESAANGTIGLSNLLIPLQFRNAYVSSWNAAIEQALAHNMSFQIAYVANHGRRIDEAQNINNPSIFGQSGTYDPLNVLSNKTASLTQYFIGDSTNYEFLQAQLNAVWQCQRYWRSSCSPGGDRQCFGLHGERCTARNQGKITSGNLTRRAGWLRSYDFSVEIETSGAAQIRAERAYMGFL